MAARKQLYKKVALTLSILAIVVWVVMGTGTSLAWFTDADDGTKNIFHFAKFEVQVEYKDENGVYQDLEGSSSVFDDDALYEPGYTQVVYLRVTNLGDVPFDFTSAVLVKDYTVAINMLGQSFLLQDYLRFGLVAAPTEAALDALVGDRDQAKTYAQMPLNNYESKKAALDPNETVYMALIIHMPENVNNVANYRGEIVPRIELGIIVTATQQDME